jgi:Zn-dependent peptidase ImmA (M78 family)
MSDWHHGVEVPPLSTEQIRRLTTGIRTSLGLDDGQRFPVLRFLEHGLPTIFDELDIEIVPDLPDGKEASTYPDGCREHPDGPLILITEAVYDAARAGQGRARLTLMHEAGHVFLHRDIPPALNRRVTDFPAYRNSEWQATTFGAELLMPPASFGDERCIEDFCRRMGVSRAAAETQATKLSQKGVIVTPRWL